MKDVQECPGTYFTKERRVIMRRFHLNVNQLKIIAIVAMTIDHIAAVFLPEGPLKIILRCIGRLAAPIMCYMIAEGYHHTSNRRRYLLRLLIFALIAHIPFNLTMYGTLNPLYATSVMWSLAMGLLALMIVKDDRLHPLFRIGGLAICCLLAYTANWNYIAVLWVVLFGWYHGNKKMQMLSFALVALAFHIPQHFLPLVLGWRTAANFKNWYQPGVFLAIPLLLAYDGSHGKKSRFMKQIFYWYYPFHLLVLYIADWFMK